MSHFSVMVFGEDVERQLAPFHEFECTGRDDEYVVDVDVTEKLRERWQGETVQGLVDPEGNHHDPYSDAFYRELTDEEQKKVGPIAGSGCIGEFSFHSKDWGDGKGYRTKTPFVPPGWMKVEMPLSAVYSFAEYVRVCEGVKLIAFGQTPDLQGEHKYGYALLREDGEVEKVIDRTNPNAKWDWWVEGGRCRNYFLLKDGSRAHKAKVKDIDVRAMEDADARKALETFDRAADIIAGRTWESWESVKAREEDVKKAHAEYAEQDVIQDFSKADDPLRFSIDLDRYMTLTREQAEREARRSALRPFAFILDGQWYEKGEAGWFGVVFDEKPEDEWDEIFHAAWSKLSPETVVTVVDCHI